MKEYISFVRRQMQPTLSAEAKCILLRYYQLQRQSDNRQSARTTVRLLESLVRLSEAHAKVMMRSQVVVEDAVTAITCVSLSQLSANTSLLDEATAEVDGTFEEYRRQEESLFSKLRLTRASLKELCKDNSNHKEFALAIAESHPVEEASDSCATSALFIEPERSEDVELYPTEMDNDPSPNDSRPLFDEIIDEDNGSINNVLLRNGDDSSAIVKSLHSSVDDSQHYINDHNGNKEKKSSLFRPFFDLDNDDEKGERSNKRKKHLLEATSSHEIVRIESQQNDKSKEINQNVTNKSSHNFNGLQHCEDSTKLPIPPLSTKLPIKSEFVKPPGMSSSLGKRFRQLTPTFDDW